MCTNFQHLANPAYDKPRAWIRDQRDDGKTWEAIRSFVIDDFDQFIRPMQFYGWPTLTKEELAYILDELEQTERRNLLNIRNQGLAIVVGSASDNGLNIPIDHKSSWQLYKKKLQNDGFAEKSIEEIEKAAHKVVKHISLSTVRTDNNDGKIISNPTKGLVIGNVQSGKTANMAAVMSMAADHGWNMFIVLSGTIENLRLQTQERLLNDLNVPGNIKWNLLDQLCKTRGSKVCNRAYEPNQLDFSNTSRDRHFVVCLKNSVRLKDLYNWLCWIPNVQKNMKVLVIDDECDQASINTALPDSERKAINRTLCSIVNCNKYAAMNYIGYTATPYANILNETSLESLYPKDFIITLPVSKEYLGPQQIFGCENTQYEGLSIVRTVSNEEIKDFKAIHKGIITYLPNSLEKAICWFLCCVSTMRYRDYKKPISMLVHTSQKIQHHEFISNIIQDWLNNTSTDSIIAKCKVVWEEESSKFPKEEFIELYPDYGQKDQIWEYPLFKQIEDGIITLLRRKVTPIQFDSTDSPEYHEGIHLCVDNSSNTMRAGAQENWRLSYPSPKLKPYPTPAQAFLVIGGATLSRGLTIEGLVSTFFLREVGTADTLMQMGRWFGYRKRYELLPRIWMSDKTQSKFVALSLLDQNLRDEIKWMEDTGNVPSQYAAKLDYLGIIKLSARNRTQAMVPAEMDFSGSFNQTYLFDDDYNILNHNLELTTEFINKLGLPETKKPINSHSNNCVIWRDISFDRIYDFIQTFKFNQRLSVFNDLTPLTDWIREITNNGKLGRWNIILAGKSSGDKVQFNNCSITKINRTRKTNVANIDGLINIGVLSAPSDLIADIDLDNQTADYVTRFEQEKKSEKLYKKLRYDSGLGAIPQLIIYIVDKNSTASEASLRARTRSDLHAPTDIVGICINVPGAQKNGRNNISKVHALLMQPDGDDIE